VRGSTRARGVGEGGGRGKRGRGDRGFTKKRGHCVTRCSLRNRVVRRATPNYTRSNSIAVMLLLGDALIELEPRSTAITSSSSPESRLDQLRIIAKSRREHRITAIMAGRERERERKRERERERGACASRVSRHELILAPTFLRRMRARVSSQSCRQARNDPRYRKLSTLASLLHTFTDLLSSMNRARCVNLFCKIQIDPAALLSPFHRSTFWRSFSELGILG